MNTVSHKNCHSLIFNYLIIINELIMTPVSRREPESKIEEMFIGTNNNNKRTEMQNS